MNKRELLSNINRLKLKMMDRDTVISQMLKQITIQDRDIYIEFQRIENELRKGK